MIERYIYVRLNKQHAGERDAVLRHSREVLAKLPGVVQVTAGLPADEHAEKAWDLGIAVRFASLDDVEAYGVHPDHRQFVDEYLAPRMEVIKAWNFELL